MPFFCNGKVVIVGDKMCGKTALLAALNEKSRNYDLIDDYVPTIVGDCTIDIKVDSKHVLLNFYDTNSFYKRLRPLGYPKTDVFLMCFSIDNPNTLKNITEIWVPEIKTYCPDVLVILIGTKTDMRDDPMIMDSLEEELIDGKYGYRVAKKIKAVTYIECSAKTKEGIREILEVTAKAVLKKKKSGKLCQLL